MTGSSIDSSSSTSRGHHLPDSGVALPPDSDEEQQGGYPDEFTDLPGLQVITEADKRRNGPSESIAPGPQRIAKSGRALHRSRKTQRLKRNSRMRKRRPPSAM